MRGATFNLMHYELCIMNYALCIILYLAPPSAFTNPFISKSKRIMLARE